MPQAQMETQRIRPLPEIIREVVAAVENARVAGRLSNPNVKDLRWQFDQVSAKMNQSIYNDQTQQIHETCLATVAVLIEILARS